VEHIEIHVNGKVRSVPSGIRVEGLLETLGLDGRTVVVELNRDILRRTDHADTGLEAGDRVEIVHFVGGG